MSPSNTPTTPASEASQAQNSSINSNTNSRRNNRNNNNNRSNNNTTVLISDTASFEGGFPETNGVVGLRTEKINKKVPFSMFTEILADCVITELRHASDIELSIRL